MIVLLLAAFSLGALTPKTYLNVPETLNNWSAMNGITAILICNNKPQPLDSYSYFKGRQDALAEAAWSFENSP